MDWTPVVATLAGGLIGTLAETSVAEMPADKPTLNASNISKTSNGNMIATCARPASESCEMRHAMPFSTSLPFCTKTQSHFWTLTEQKYQTTKYSSAPSLSFFP